MREKQISKARAKELIFEWSEKARNHQKMAGLHGGLDVNGVPTTVKAAEHYGRAIAYGICADSIDLEFGRIS